MKYPLIISFFLFTHLSSFGQNVEKYNQLFECQQTWNYLNLTDSVKGTIVFYQQPLFDCGTLSVASCALIISSEGDTLRVLTMCHSKYGPDTPDEFKPGNKVVIIPNKQPSFRVDEVPVDVLSCIILKTYFGTIRKE